MCDLRAIRQEQNLFQKNLAAAGLTATGISRYQTGNKKISVEIAKRLSKVLETNWINLLEEQEMLSDAR